MAANAYPLRRETSTLSSDGSSWLRIVVWLPDPVYTRRGVVQLVHGMAEHIDRYGNFARFLAGLGYVVFGHDHIGHGKSVASRNQLGNLPLEGGAEILIEDTLRVRTAALQFAGEEGELSLFLFGHSMGSFVVRASLVNHAAGLAGAVICGTGNQPAALLQAGKALARTIGAVRGADYRSALLERMGAGSFAGAIEDARTESDWLSTDPAVVDAFLADPLCGQLFSVGGYATLCEVTLQATSKKGAALIPKNLPLLLIAGEEDPVGNKGAYVQRAAKLYKDAGIEEVQVIMYPGMRHEILNEPNRAQVYSDVEEWFTRQMVSSVVSPRAAEPTEESSE